MLPIFWVVLNNTQRVDLQVFKTQLLYNKYRVLESLAEGFSGYPVL